jgi:hypothetical protein
MAGFTLPKFRWLVLGATAAGVWAMMQDVPRRTPAPAPASTAQREKAQSERVTRKELPAVQQTARAAPETPRAIAPPEPRPSPLVTASIPRPVLGVGEKADGRKLFATSKVRMREEANTSSAVVTMLPRGQSVRLISKKGSWRLVSVGGTTGWVREDYLASSAPAPSVETAIAEPKKLQVPEPAKPRILAPPPRPLAEPVLAAEQPARQPEPLGRVYDWSSMSPSRAPQGGDCQCPYDLMLSGLQCGDHSAYARNPEAVQCFM